MGEGLNNIRVVLLYHTVKTEGVSTDSFQAYNTLKSELLKVCECVGLKLVERSKVGGKDDASNIRFLSEELISEVLIAVAFQHSKVGEPRDSTSLYETIEKISSIDKRVFTIVFGKVPSEDPCIRLGCLKKGARMVCYDMMSLTDCIRKISTSSLKSASMNAVRNSSKIEQDMYSCPACLMPHLSECQLQFHYSLYHCTEANISCKCPVCAESLEACRGGFSVHINNAHGKKKFQEPELNPASLFSWVVIHNPMNNKFVLVNEPAGLSRGAPRYWLPAGRLDRNETFVEAAEREAEEEAGIKIKVTGILRFIGDKGIIFLAEPLKIMSPSPLKTVPDFESAGAIWVTIDQLNQLDRDDFRDVDPLELYNAVNDGSIAQAPLLTERLEESAKMIKSEEKLQDKEVWKSLLKEYPENLFFEFY